MSTNSTIHVKGFFSDQDKPEKPEIQPPVKEPVVPTPPEIKPRPEKQEPVSPPEINPSPEHPTQPGREA